MAFCKWRSEVTRKNFVPCCEEEAERASDTPRELVSLVEWCVVFNTRSSPSLFLQYKTMNRQVRVQTAHATILEGYRNLASNSRTASSRALPLSKSRIKSHRCGNLPLRPA